LQYGTLSQKPLFMVVTTLTPTPPHDAQADGTVIRAGAGIDTL
jgi:hypothetical protein